MGKFTEKTEHGYRYYFDDDDDHATIHEFTKKAATETGIPSELGGKPVVSIDAISFIRNESLTTVKIPESIREINQGDMTGNTPWPVSLEQFEVDPLNESFQSIDGVLFDKAGETLLAFPTAKRGDYAMPDSVRTVQPCAFYSDKNRIGTLRIPAAFTLEGVSALPSTVAEYLVHPDNPFIASRDGVIYDKDFRVLLKCPSRRKGDLAVPEGVGEAAKGAFHCIASFQARYIDTLHLPASFALPDDDALTYAAKRFDVAPGNPVLRSIDGFLVDHDGKLLGPHGPWGHARVIRNGKRVTRLFATPEERAVTIPEGVKTIPDRHFSGSILKSVSIPASVESLGKGVFSHCSWLTDAAIDAAIEELPATTFEECGSLERVTLPANLKTIGTSAFKDCGKLAGIELPAHLEVIEDAAFSSCKSLARVTLPESVAFLGSDAFYRCSNLVDVTLSPSLRKIMAGTFSDCFNLTAINIPEPIEQVSPYAFENTRLAKNDASDTRKTALPSGMKIRCPKCKQEIDYVVWRDYAWHDDSVFSVVEPAAIKSKSTVDIFDVVQTAAEDRLMEAADLNLFSEGTQCDADMKVCWSIGFKPTADPKSNRVGAICPRCFQLLNMKPRR